MTEIIVCADADDYKAMRKKIDDFKRAEVSMYGPDKRSFTKEEMAAIGLPSPTNAERSAVEAWEFQNGTPDRYTVYVNLDEKVVTTWTGQILGRITDVGREWKDSMGGKRVPLTVVGINGVVYYGTYFKSSGDYAHLRAKRHKGSIVVKVG